MSAAAAPSTPTPHPLVHLFSPCINFQHPRCSIILPVHRLFTPQEYTLHKDRGLACSLMHSTRGQYLLNNGMSERCHVPFGSARNPEPCTHLTGSRRLVHICPGCKGHASPSVSLRTSARPQHRCFVVTTAAVLPGPLCRGWRGRGPSSKGRGPRPGCQNPQPRAMLRSAWDLCPRKPFHASSPPHLPSVTPNLPSSGPQPGLVCFLGSFMVPPRPGRWVGRTPLPFCHLLHPIRQGKLTVSLTANTQTD